MQHDLCALILLIAVGCGPGMSSSTISDESTGSDATVGSTGPASTGSGPASTGSGDSTLPTSGDAGSCEGLDPIPEDAFPERIAELVCAQKAACGCATDGDPSCESFRQYFAEARSVSASLGLTYNGLCLARRLQALVHSGCTVQDSFEGLHCDDCWTYDGERESGDECDITYIEDNRVGQQCVNDADSCYSVSGKGLVCLPPMAEGGACAFLGECGPGLQCDFSKQCVSAKADEPCVGPGGDYERCSAGLWCDSIQVCRTRRAIGEDCTQNEMCETLQCMNDICVDGDRVCSLQAPFFDPPPPV